MRNWTIGKKITLYYAAVLIAFTAVFCVAVYFSAVNQIKDTARTTLTSAVDDGFEHIVYDEGIIQIGDDFQTNYRGVAIIKSVDLTKFNPIECECISGDDLHFAILDNHGLETTDNGNTYHIVDHDRCFSYSDLDREVFVTVCE